MSQTFSKCTAWFQTTTSIVFVWLKSWIFNLKFISLGGIGCQRAELARPKKLGSTWVFGSSLFEPSWADLIFLIIFIFIFLSYLKRQHCVAFLKGCVSILFFLRLLGWLGLGPSSQNGTWYRAFSWASSGFSQVEPTSRITVPKWGH